MNNNKIIISTIKSLKALAKAFPVLIGIVLLISISNILIPPEAYGWLFQNNKLIDAFIGGSLGSILAGNPITSYIIGGELLTQGVGLMAITAFLTSWVTVGMLQLPGEIILLGKKFAIARNIVAFFLSIFIAIGTVLVMSI